MQINNVKNKQSFGMKLNPYNFYTLSGLERYAFYKLNKEITSIRGPKITCQIYKDYAGFMEDKTATIVGLGKNCNILHACKGRHATIEDLQAFLDKVLASKNKFQKIFYNFYPKSQKMPTAYRNLPYDTDESKALQNLVKMDNEKEAGDKTFIFLGI